MSDAPTEHNTIRFVYKAVLETSLDSGGDGTVLVRGLSQAAGIDELTEVAELEAGMALLHLRHRAGIVLSVDEWLDGPFAAVMQDTELDRDAATALIRRVAATAGGLWEPPTKVLLRLDRIEIIVAYLLVALACVTLEAQVTERGEADVLNDVFAFSDEMVAGGGGATH